MGVKFVLSKSWMAGGRWRGIYTPPRKRAVAARGIGYSDISQDRIIRLSRIIRFNIYRIFQKSSVRHAFKVLSRIRAKHENRIIRNILNRIFRKTLVCITFKVLSRIRANLENRIIRIKVDRIIRFPCLIKTDRNSKTWNAITFSFELQNRWNQFCWKY